MPQLSVNPGDAGDEALGLDRAKDCTSLRIDLIDFSVPILPDPQRSFSPGEPRPTTTGRRDRGEHAAGLRIDLLNPIFGKLIQMLAVKGSSCMRADTNLAHGVSACRI